MVAADRAGLRDTVNAVITITDQSEGPVIAGMTSYTVAENYDIAQVLGSYTATDAKDNRPVHPRWSLSGRDGGDFTINERGELAFRSIPDYDRPADSDRDNVYEVTVRGHDSRAYGNLDVTVRVTPVNEHDPVVTGRQTLSFRENTAAATRLHAYRATDGDRDTSFTWSVEGDDQDDFAIAEGVLTFSAPPDYEQPADSDRDNVYEVTVVASDDGANRGTLDVTVTVSEQSTRGRWCRALLSSPSLRTGTCPMPSTPPGTPRRLAGSPPTSAGDCRAATAGTSPSTAIWEC